METFAHFVFTPKYRRALLSAEVAAEIERRFDETATRYGFEIVALGIQPDHVHLLVAVPTRYSFAEVAMRFKWWSSLHARRAFPELVQLRAFWGRRYFVKGISGSRATAKQYIQDQHLPVTRVTL